MRKAAVLWLVLVTALWAERIEFFATRLDSNLSGIHAYGDVLVLYGDYYLSADEAVYDRNTSTLELFGDITAMQGAEYFAMGDYAKLDAATKTREFSPFFMLDRHTDVWMSSLRSGAVDKDFTVEDGMVSGCDPNHPLWTLDFSKADFNSKTRWMNVYNARLRIYGIPVFYFPYFGYSLDNRRRSGLLVPSFGISGTEGVFFEQPMYLAIDNSWDLELRPQVRTYRGSGVYGTFRFVDSNVSKGKFRAGYFKEKGSYANRYNLANDRHYGFDFDYVNYAFLQRWFGLSELKGQSGLYSKVSWMNDIDYINLSSNDTVKFATSNQVLSRVNLFYNAEDVYYGMNFRYYLDLNKQSNTDTLQNLPTMRYHRYMDTYFNEHLYYTFDARANHLFREKGINGVEGTVDLPVTLQTSVLDDYLALSYSARLNGRYITFRGQAPRSNVISKGIYNTGLFGRFYNVLSAATQVTKKYDSFDHTMGFEAAYTKAGVDYSSGYYKDKREICSRPDAGENYECDFYTVNEIEESLDMRFTQFFNADDGSQIVYHRVTQRLSFDRLKEKLSELENELDWQMTPALSLYSDVFYNYDRHLVSRALNAVRYKDAQFDVGLSDLFENRLTDEGSYFVNYVTFDAAYRYGKHYRYFGRYAYDVEQSRKKLSEIGFLYAKRCWEFGMRYVENNRPILTYDEASSVFDRYVYFTIMFKPIGGTEVNYKISDALEGS